MYSDGKQKSDGTQKQKGPQINSNKENLYYPGNYAFVEKFLNPEAKVIHKKSETKRTANDILDKLENLQPNTFETYIYLKDNDYMAGIKMSYNTDDSDQTDYLYGIEEKELYVSMQPKEDGTADFTYNKPTGMLSNTQTIVDSRTIVGALSAISDYIAKNQGKKYGRFFGLYRNSNSFVKKITKSVPGLKDAAQMHSAFTAKGARNNIESSYQINEGVPQAARPNPNFKLNHLLLNNERLQLASGKLNLIDLLSSKEIKIDSLSEQNRIYNCSLKDILEDSHKNSKLCPYQFGYLFQLLKDKYVKLDDLNTAEKYGFTLTDAINNGWIRIDDLINNKIITQPQLLKMINNDSEPDNLRFQLATGKLNLIDLLSNNQIKSEGLSKENQLYNCSLKDILEDSHKNPKLCPYQFGYLFQLLKDKYVKLDDLNTAEKYGFTLTDAINNGWIKIDDLINNKIITQSQFLEMINNV